jgi:hypothetical protein
MKLHRLCMRSWLFFVLASVFAHSQSYRIFQTFHGRFHCNGQWNEFDLRMSPSASPLGITDVDDPAVTGSISFLFHTSVTSVNGVT